MYIKNDGRNVDTHQHAIVQALPGFRCKTRMNKKDSEQASPGEDPKGLKEQKVEMAAKPPGA